MVYPLEAHWIDHYDMSLGDAIAIKTKTENSEHLLVKALIVRVDNDFEVYMSVKAIAYSERYTSHRVGQLAP
jgi:hypothetical protein